MVREQFAKLSVVLKDVQVQILYPPQFNLKIYIMESTKPNYPPTEGGE